MILMTAYLYASTAMKKVYTFTLFFATLLLAPLMGFIFYYIFANIITDTMIDLAKFFEGVETLYFIIVGISFFGIYIARLIVWALKR
jgi:hypothetical protein